MTFWNKLSQKEKIGLSAAITFMVIASFDRLVIDPIFAKLKQMSQEIKISEKQLGHDLRNVHQKDQISELFGQYVAYVERSGSDEEEVGKILAEIEALARKSNVHLVDVKPQTPKEVDFYKEYDVEVEAEGEIVPLMEFLHQLNTSDQLLRVEKLRLNSKKKGKQTLKASMLIGKILIL